MDQFAYYDQPNAATAVLKQGSERPSFFAAINTAVSLMLKEPSLTIPSSTPTVS